MLATTFATDPLWILAELICVAIPLFILSLPFIWFLRRREKRRSHPWYPIAQEWGGRYRESLGAGRIEARRENVDVTITHLGKGKADRTRVEAKIGADVPSDLEVAFDGEGRLAARVDDRDVTARLLPDENYLQKLEELHRIDDGVRISDGCLRFEARGFVTEPDRLEALLDAAVDTVFYTNRHFGRRR